MKPLPMYGGSCTKCGDCCRVVTLRKKSVDDVKLNRTDKDGRLHIGVAPGHGTSSPEDQHDRERCERWFRDELHELTPEEAEARMPGISQIVGKDQAMYRCDNFDEQTNLCRSYQDRPSICTDFPNYHWPTGHDMSQERHLLDGLPRCGYYLIKGEETK